jgi:two-component system sensor histidine kinase/response regulator
LNKSEKELKLLNVTKDKFFSIIAHDLRNPFTALVSLSEILSEKVETMTPERRKEVIDQISYAASNTYRLLGNLLEWSRSQQEGVKFTPEIIPLGPLTEEIVSLQLSLATQKELNVAIDVDPNVEIETDKHMISFVIRNLLGNAMKFTPKGGNITLEAKSGKTEVIYKVIDTGVGISRANIEKLFDLNNHFTSEGTNKEKGIGLGLVLCKEFVDRMGGMIRVESVPGSGSTFSFQIPKKPKPVKLKSK